VLGEAWWDDHETNTRAAGNVLYYLSLAEMII